MSVLHKYKRIYRCFKRGINNAGTDQFYYSTIYGLNVPVCSMCVEEKEKEDFEEYEEEEFDEYADHVFVYQEDELEPQTCSVCNYNGCSSFYYSSDNMNKPVCATCETKYRETVDCSQRIYHDEYRPTSPQEEYKGTYWYYSYYPLSDIQSCSECMYNGAGFFLTDGYKVTVCYDCGEKVSNSDSDDNDSEYTPSDEESMLPLEIWQQYKNTFNERRFLKDFNPQQHIITIPKNEFIGKLLT